MFTLSAMSWSAEAYRDIHPYAHRAYGTRKSHSRRVAPSPATPGSVSSAGGWIIKQVGSVIAILNWVFGNALLAAIMIVVIAMFTWEYIYAATMWVIRKIPMINIH